MTAPRHTGACPCGAVKFEGPTPLLPAPSSRGEDVAQRQAGTPVKRWLGVLLLMLGGVGAEAVRPGPCQLLSDTWTQRPRERRDGRERLDEREHRRRGF